MSAPRAGPAEPVPAAQTACRLRRGRRGRARARRAWGQREAGPPGRAPPARQTAQAGWRADARGPARWPTAGPVAAPGSRAGLGGDEPFDICISLTAQTPRESVARREEIPLLITVRIVKRGRPRPQPTPTSERPRRSWQRNRLGHAAMTATAHRRVGRHVQKNKAWGETRSPIRASSGHASLNQLRHSIRQNLRGATVSERVRTVKWQVSLDR